jgi:hypothetical protein
MTLLQNNINTLKSSLDLTTAVSSRKIHNFLHDNDYLLDQLNGLRQQVKNLTIENQRLQAKEVFDEAKKVSSKSKSGSREADDDDDDASSNSSRSSRRHKGKQKVKKLQLRKASHADSLALSLGEGSSLSHLQASTDYPRAHLPPGIVDPQIVLPLAAPLSERSHDTVNSEDQNYAKSKEHLIQRVLSNEGSDGANPVDRKKVCHSFLTMQYSDR